MKIFSAGQLLDADRFTLKAQNITSWELMERAATLAFSAIHREYKNEAANFKVFCGIGNNGGDGLVIARKFIEYGFETQVFVAEYNTNHTPEFDENLHRLKALNGAKIQFLNEESSLPELTAQDVIIDSIFGIGLNRTLPDWVANLIAYINNSGAKVFAIDMPSGLFSDRISSEDGQVIKAYKTLTFQNPKLVFYLPDTQGYTGKIEVLNIGLDQNFLQQQKPLAELITSNKISSLLKERSLYSHKGTYGHCLIAGGSYGKMGAMVLAAKAALRAGTGKVTAMIPRCGYDIMQIASPETMVLTGNENKYLAYFEEPYFVPEAICFGMGAGQDKETGNFFKSLMKYSLSPMLIDADGLNLLAENRKYLKHIPKNSVLTPHPGELARLVGKWSDDFEKMEKVQKFVDEHQVIMVVKGYNTMIFSGEQIFINTTGNPGMATAGSGDVLSGFIGGLMAQSYTPEEAALIGVYLHGLTGDIAVEKSAVESLVAGDLIDNFGNAFRQLKNLK